MSREPEFTSEEQVNEYRRKLRQAASDTKGYNEEKQAEIKRQRGTIDKLSKENKSLKDEIANFQKFRDLRSLRPQSALETPESYEEKIRQEEQKLQEYEESIKVLQEKLLRQRRQMGGINASRDSNNALNKQLKILENRLDKANQKFNEAIANNKQLREQIDNLRRERVIFDSIYQKLEKELQDKRKEMANIIEAANAAYEDRDRAQKSLEDLKKQAEKEEQEFEREWRELNNVLEKDKKMKELIRMKQQERERTELATPAHAEEESTRKRKAPTASQLNAERVRSYEEAFTKIQSATQIRDINELVNSFIQAEEKNFTLFRFVNEVSNDIENLESQIQEMQLEIESFKGRDIGVNSQRKKQLKELEEKLDKYENKAEMYELKASHDLKTLAALKIAIQQMFRTAGCDQAYATEFLGSAVTESNIRPYLGMIEQRASELMHAYTIVQAQKGRTEGLLATQQIQAVNPVKIDAPKMNLSDEEEEVEEDEKPFTAEEFRQRAEKKQQSVYEQTIKSTQSKTRPKAKSKAKK